MPDATRSNVVLPLPDGPSRQTTSPGAMSRLNPANASVSPYRRSTLSKVSRAAKVAAARPVAGAALAEADFGVDVLDGEGFKLAGAFE